MEEESPLDVLSRAATMLQESQNLSLADESPKQLVQKQITKWKRDRRSRLPEYTRKSDPKIQEIFGSDLVSESNKNTDFVDISNDSHENDCGSELEFKTISRIGSIGNSSLVDTPLDMSVRQRGLPPSYSQTVNSPSYRSNCRPQIIQNGDTTNREEIRSGMSMCDPIIDEHFRRSLGSDYHAIFQNNNVFKEQVPSNTSPSTPAISASGSSAVEMIDNSGLSVDEHFAKALGDTWFRLNSKGSKTKSSPNKNNLVTI